MNLCIEHFNTLGSMCAREVSKSQYKAKCDLNMAIKVDVNALKTLYSFFMYPFISISYKNNG